MAKRIFPGNFVNRLSAYQNQCVVAQPGRAFYSALGYALITATPAVAWDITIPSPDMRADNKPRPDRVGLVLPAGAAVYAVGIRVPDMRKERSAGTAFSGLVGTNGELLKVADALANNDAITTSAVATTAASVAVASTTIAPVAHVKSLVTAPILAGAETLRLFLTAANGTDAGTALTSTVAGGTPIIVEAHYFLNDDVADVEDVRLPFRVEN